MRNKGAVGEWVAFAKMDFDAAKHLYENMEPRPFEIICYHCEQAVEKMLKAALLANGEKTQKTHDLGLLAEQLGEYKQIEEKYVEMCDNLTPYGVKIRYPQELFIEDHHVRNALKETDVLFKWLNELLAEK